MGHPAQEAHRTMPRKEAGQNRRRRGRRASLAALIATGVAAVVGIAGVGTPGAAGHRDHRVVLSPHPGEAVPARGVLIRVHAGKHVDVFRAQLNGHEIGQEFSEPSDRGVRRLHASLSHGLNHGRNKLHVRADDRRKSVRFRVRHGRPLVGAGPDRQVPVGSEVILKARHLSPGSRHHKRGRWSKSAQLRAAGSQFQWETTNGPVHHEQGGGTSLDQPSGDGQHVVFRPTLAGRYKLTLSVTSNGTTASDSTTVKADPTPAVPVDTMAEEGGDFGIRVGTGPDSFFPAHLNSWAQLVTLQRDSLEPDPNLQGLTNKSYDCPFSQVNPGEGTDLPQCVAQLQADLNKIDSHHIVIVANQPWQGDPLDVQHPYRLELALGRIGVAPTSFSRPPSCQPCYDSSGNDVNADDHRLTGSISAIGVPGTPEGEGDWHAVPSQDAGTGQGQMTGYLVRNNDDDYTFEAYDRIDFNTQAPGSSSSQNVIRVGDESFSQSFNGGGFGVVVLDAQTLQGESHSFVTTNTGIDVLRQQLEGMRDLLHDANHAKDPKLVVVTSLGQPAIQYYSFHHDTTPYAPLNKDLSQLVDEVEQLGGTRNAFYKMLDPALYDQNSYTLVSGSNSGPGQGEESVGQGITGNGTGPLNTTRMSGALARTGPNYGFEVQGAPRTGPEPSGGDPTRGPSELAHIVLQEPTQWPEQGNAGRTAAIAWIGNHTPDLMTPDVRGQYWTKKTVADQFNYSGWREIAYEIQGLQYPQDKPDCSPDLGFCAADLDWAKKELAGPLTNPALVGGEIRWLIKTHEYLDGLATPYAKTQQKSWANLQTKANEISSKVGASDDAPVRARAMAFFDLARGLVEELPKVGKAIHVLNDVYELVVELSEINHEPAGEDFPSTASKVGDALADRMFNAQETLTRQLPNVISADYGKLKAVGACSTGDQAGCPFNVADWSYGQDFQSDAGKGLLQATDAWASGELLSARYSLYQLPPYWRTTVGNNFDFYAKSFPTLSYPFHGLPESAQVAKPIYRNLATYNYKFDPPCGLSDDYCHTVGETWQISALGFLKSGGGTLFNPWVMGYPDASITDPLFKPVAQGGFGMDPETFFDTNFTGKELKDFPYEGITPGWRPNH
jgi:hypothetical protein